MYDYMRALQSVSTVRNTVNWTSRSNTLERNCGGTWTPRGVRNYLRLLDAQNTLLVESKLMSFTAGFKLAASIAGELGAPYSFEADEGKTQREMIVNG